MFYQQQASAKINLGLHVLQRRSDGYHDVETVLLAIDWADCIRVGPSDRLTMSTSDPDLPTDERNLCIQAAQLLAAETGCERGAAIYLDKYIPFGAGLGGGSSDAAASLQLLKRLWKVDCSENRLQILAARLGADVPFFLEGGVGLATGRGDQVRRIDDYCFPYWLVVVMPPVRVATVEAYRRVRPNNTGRPDLTRLVRSNDLAAWQSHLVNDFEAAVFEQYPVIASVKEQLVKTGAEYAALSGSGSAVFGVFNTGQIARHASEQFAGMEDYTAWWGQAKRS